MTTQEGKNAVVARHLEALANAAKEYTLAELANISVSGESYTLPTASETLKGGVKIGDGLQMDGDTLNVTIQSGSSGGGYIIGSAVSSVEGGFWQGTINDTPVLKLRHGDYEYNFVYDNITYLGGASSALVNTTPDTYVIGTASVSNDGGVWYEVDTNNVPTLNLHAGSFNYSFNYDSVTYKGDNSNLAAYLPLNVSPTTDACGNVWTATGTPTIVDGKLYLNGSSWLTNTTIADSIGSLPWTLDFWATQQSTNGSACGIEFKDENSSNYILGIDRDASADTLTLVVPNKFRAFSQGQYELNVRHHVALTYDGSNIRLFVDGLLAVERALQITLYGNLTVGNSTFRMTGTIDHFRVFKGQALWTENFTPPTAADYL